MKRTCFESGDQAGFTQQPPVVSCRSSGSGTAVGTIVGTGASVGGIFGPPESGGRTSGEPGVAIGCVGMAGTAGLQAAMNIIDQKINVARRMIFGMVIGRLS